MFARFSFTKINGLSTNIVSLRVWSFHTKIKKFAGRSAGNTYEKIASQNSVNLVKRSRIDDNKA